MIENIHSHEGEEEKNTSLRNYTFKPPKNIKQIGESTSQKKIYVEDYVFTYIKDLTKKEYAGCKIAVLLGKYIKGQDTKTIVINGAVEAVGANMDADTAFSNDTWTSIYENIKQYFTDVEVVGWYIGGPGFLLENEDKIKKIHIDNFAGVDKALLRYDSLEGEEGFYLYEHNQLSKQSGYYIYYEKNDEMQNYIVNHKSENCKNLKETKEQYVKEYKEEVKEQKVEENNKSVMHLMYAAGTLMAVIVIVIAATIINNNGKIKDLQKAVNNINSNIYATTDDKAKKDANLGETDSEATMNVETISGRIDSSKESIVGDRFDEKQKNDSSKNDSNSSNEEVAPVNREEKQDVKEGEPVKEDKPQIKEKQKSGETTKPKDVRKSKNQNDTQKKEESTKPTSTTSNNKVNYYTVEQGDTLASICIKLYNSTDNVKKIIELNGIDDQDKILYGQKLIVP